MCGSDYRKVLAQLRHAFACRAEMPLWVTQILAPVGPLVHLPNFHARLFGSVRSLAPGMAAPVEDAIMPEQEIENDCGHLGSKRLQEV